MSKQSKRAGERLRNEAALRGIIYLFSPEREENVEMCEWLKSRGAEIQNPKLTQLIELYPSVLAVIHARAAQALSELRDDSAPAAH